MTKQNYTLIVILGPTASGKTSVAANLSFEINGEIISADSRQVYRELTLGTGKDYSDYTVNNTSIPCHLIDIANPGTQYNVYEYQKDFFTVYNNILSREKIPVLCGGSGMYIEAVLENYQLIQVPVNQPLRNELELKSPEELAEILKNLKKTHANSDFDTKKRTIRAIEIELFHKNNSKTYTLLPEINPLIIGIRYPRDIERNRITQRLTQRLETGMLTEVETLLNKGLTAEQLIYYGLEYKYITLHLTGQISYTEMFNSLNTAIHQFAKRQMTWFRRMERKGTNIHWLDGFMPMEEKVKAIVELYR